MKQSLCASADSSNQDDEDDEYAAVQKEFDKNIAEKKRQQELEGNYLMFMLNSYSCKLEAKEIARKSKLRGNQLGCINSILSKRF